MALNLYYMKSILEFLMKHPEMAMIFSLSLYSSSLLSLPAFCLPKHILLTAHSPLITVLVMVLQNKNRTGHKIKGFIIRNLLIWFGEAEKAQDLQSEGLITRLVNEGSSSLSLKVWESEENERKTLQRVGGKHNCLVLRAKLSRSALLCSLQAFTSWMKSSHFGESNLLYSLY